MKIRLAALRSLVQESVGKDRIIKERPWSVEHTFSMKGGIASDSEGEAPDGFFIALVGESGTSVRVVVDSYWNPAVGGGDQSGNELRVEGETIQNGPSTRSYVPIKFDSGEEQVIVVSNSPTLGMVLVSHGLANSKSLPVTYLAFPNPFQVDEDIDFVPQKLGNGKDLTISLTRHTNL